MRREFDYEVVNRTALAAYPNLLIGWFPAGAVVGIEFRVGDLDGTPATHGKSDGSLSINIRTGAWADFETGAKGGDPVSLFAARHKLGQLAAAKARATEQGIDPSRRPRAKNGGVSGTRASHGKPGGKRLGLAVPKSMWQCTRPASVAVPSHIVHDTLGTPDHVFPYLELDGTIACAVLQWDARPPRGKIIQPFSYGCLDGVEGWHFKYVSAPRPLMQANVLTVRPTANVLLVEGELKAILKQRALDAAGEDYVVSTWIGVVSTWIGGSSAVAQTEWATLEDRVVLCGRTANSRSIPKATRAPGRLGRIASNRGLGRPRRWRDTWPKSRCGSQLSSRPAASR